MSYIYKVQAIEPTDRTRTRNRERSSYYTTAKKQEKPSISFAEAIRNAKESNTSIDNEVRKLGLYDKYKELSAYDNTKPTAKMIKFLKSAAKWSTKITNDDIAYFIENASADDLIKLKGYMDGFNPKSTIEDMKFLEQELEPLIKLDGDYYIQLKPGVYLSFDGDSTKRIDEAEIFSSFKRAKTIADNNKGAIVKRLSKAK